jgi:hypothetical protein
MCYISVWNIFCPKCTAFHWLFCNNRSAWIILAVSEGTSLFTVLGQWLSLMMGHAQTVLRQWLIWLVMRTRTWTMLLAGESKATSCWYNICWALDFAFQGRRWWGIGNIFQNWVLSKISEENNDNFYFLFYLCKFSGYRWVDLFFCNIP